MGLEADYDDAMISPPADSLADGVTHPDSPAHEEPADLAADDYALMMSTYLPLNGDLEAVDETHFTWEVENWRQLSRKEHSPVFHCGGQPWRILFFPFGNNSDHASFYLEHGYDEKPAEDWYSCVQFLLVVWNPNDPRIFVQHSATHRYTPEESDWGFTRFVELRKIHTQSWQNFGRPLVENGSARVTAYVRVVKDETGVLWHTFVHYDSKKETGMVGLKNQGTTCFLNSLIQSLYFTTAFRRAVYQMPTDINESARTLGNSPYALQRLFLQLQTSDTMVYTTELTQSFGWTNDLIYVHQQDVQELERLLMEKLEDKMKGTPIERCLPEMFMGRMKTTISCINVDYQSSKAEEFWDLALNIKGPNTLDESFQEYCQSEIMEGDNKYQAEGFGYQDAKKGVLFQSLPSVLHLQLKRFEFDFQRESPVKTNDYMEFPETWDASPYLSDDADRSEPYIYKLHSVLVHSGAIQAGHYYAFIRPEKNGHFYKFDDERVTRATLKEAIDENFGGETPTANGAPRSPTQRTFKRATNAYMLVYIRECHQDKILLPHEVVNPPANVANKFAEEKALLDQKRREKEEAHLYMDISVASNANFQHHQGIDIVPTAKTDLVDPAAIPKLYREKKKLPFSGLVEHIASDLGVDADMLRVWSMVGRQNSTVRPDHPITPTNLTVEEAFAKYGNKQAFRLWVEVADERTEDGQPLFGNERIKITRPGDKAILLFLKHFDVEKQTLYGVGQFYCAWHDKISEIGPEILKLMNWPTGTNFRIHEEIKQSMIEPLKAKSSLQQAELQDGDIITVARAIPESEIPSLGNRILEMRDFYDYLLHRIKVKFGPKNVDDSKKDPEFDLTLNKRMTYNELAAAVGKHLGVDPTHLRFSQVAVATNKAKPAIRYTTGHTLGQMLAPHYAAYGTPTHRSDGLFYEVLECSMAELETRKAIRLIWLRDGQENEEEYELLVPKAGTVTDLIDHLQRKAGFSDKVKERVHVFEVHNHKIHKDCPAQYPVVNFNEYTQLYAEPRPQEELRLAKDERLGSAFHFEREVSKSYGHPFQFLIKDGEAFGAAKERLSTRLGLKGKEVDKFKFAVVPRSGYGKAEYLSDNEILSDALGPDDYLGVDHANRNKPAANRGDQIYIK